MDAPKIPRKNATGPLTSNSLSPFHHAHSSIMEEDRSRRAASVLSMDDIEAAQALEGLRSGMICRAQRVRGGLRCTTNNSTNDSQTSASLLEHHDNPFPSLHRTHHHQSRYCRY
jgi:hypothetical protein